MITVTTVRPPKPSIRSRWTWRSTMYAVMFVYHMVLTALAVPRGHALAFVALVFFGATLPLAVEKYLPESSNYRKMTPKQKVVDMLTCAGVICTMTSTVHQQFVIAALAFVPVVIMAVLHRRRKW